MTTGAGIARGQRRVGSRLHSGLAALRRRLPGQDPARSTRDAIKASFAAVDVTPGRALPLSGFAFRQNQPFSSVAGHIELNAAVLRWRDCTLVLVTGDFLYLSGGLRDEIVAAYGARYGFGHAEVVLGASHTHFAPALDPSKPGLGTADDGYLRSVHDNVVKTLGELLNSAGEEVALRHGSCTSRHNCNRRSVVLRGDGELAIDDIMSDPGNVCDDNLDVLRLDDSKGRLRAAVVRYACHPTTFPQKLAVSAEYPSVIRGRFRAAAGRDDLPVLFFQGFAGDMVPIDPPRGEPRLATPAERLRPMKRESTLPTGEWQRWAESLAADAYCALEAAGRASPLIPRLGARERRILLSRLIDGLPGQYSDSFMSMQAIELSAELVILALSAEPTAAWTDLVADLAPDKTILPIGYVNQTYGYLPAGRELAPRGYEAGGFFEAFGLAGHFRGDLEARVLAELEALLAPSARDDAPAYRRRVAALRQEINQLRSEREVARALYLAAEKESQPRSDEPA